MVVKTTEKKKQKKEEDFRNNEKDFSLLKSLFNN